MNAISRHRQVLLTYLLLAAVPLIVFWQVKTFDFINYDDIGTVTGNQHVLRGITWDGIQWALTSGYDANWIPLTRISHMLDVQLFGTAPGWHHRTNLLLHIANTLLLFFVLHRLTKSHGESAFVAALFALHPLHVESVAWVAERKDVLSAAFWFLTMGAYSYYVERPRWERYLVVVAFFTLGLMAKPMLVTLPFVLLLLDYWPLRRIGTGDPVAQDGTAGIPKGTAWQWALVRPLLWEKIPLFVLAAASSCITYMVQQSGGAVASLETHPLGLRMGNALLSYVVYIGKMVWPQDLAVLYPYSAALSVWQIIGAAFLLIAATLAAFRTAARAPYVVTGWLWYVGTLVPVIGIVQVGLQARADRYTYIPLIGLFITVTWGVSGLSRNWRYRKEVLAASSALVLLCLSLATWKQAAYWQNSEALFGHALNVTENNHIAYNHIGTTQVERGNYQQAIANFDKALAIDPNNGSALYNRGTAYLHLGNLRESIGDFDASIRINPKNEAAYINRGTAYASLGNFKQAISDYNKVLEINPRSGEARFNRGTAYANLGDYRQAIEDYDKAIEINPRYGAAYNSRGSAYVLLGNNRQAMEDLRTAAQLGNRAAQERLSSRGLDW